jgi:hypothetical protein
LSNKKSATFQVAPKENCLFFVPILVVLDDGQPVKEHSQQEYQQSSQ